MIYILSGNGIRKKNNYLKTLTKNHEVVFLDSNSVNKETINEYANNVGLFGQTSLVVAENVLSGDSVVFGEEDIINLQDSPTTFVFLEDKLLAPEEKKYKKYAKIENFKENKILKPKTNNFAIADAFARGDKIQTWMLYRQAIEEGIEPENITGILFWKIKMMLLNGSKSFTVDQLKTQSSNIISLYHKAHQGELDFTIGLERFILSSLTK